jgi:hypothetical protein
LRLDAAACAHMFARVYMCLRHNGVDFGGFARLDGLRNKKVLRARQPQDVNRKDALMHRLSEIISDTTHCGQASVSTTNMASGFRNRPASPENSSKSRSSETGHTPSHRGKSPVGALDCIRLSQANAVAAPSVTFSPKGSIIQSCNAAPCDRYSGTLSTRCVGDLDSEKISSRQVGAALNL